MLALAATLNGPLFVASKIELLFPLTIPGLFSTLKVEKLKYWLGTVLVGLKLVLSLRSLPSPKGSSTNFILFKRVPVGDNNW